MSGRPAVFLDRDGTLIEDVHYIADPSLVRLLPGATDAVRRLNEAGIAAVVVSNQSGIARGLVTEAAYAAVHARMVALLADEHAHLAAQYHCPHHPDITGPCACRKPGRLLFDRAAAELGLDLSRSTFIGDKWRDVEPARLVGGRGVLVPSTDTPANDIARAHADAEVAASLRDAIDRALGLTASMRPR